MNIPVVLQTFFGYMYLEGLASDTRDGWYNIIVVTLILWIDFVLFKGCLHMAIQSTTISSILLLQVYLATLFFFVHVLFDIKKCTQMQTIVSVH